LGEVTKLNAFNRIAPVYDVLARAVFGESIRDAQRHYLSLISPGAKVLVLGGGTGWILPAINSIAPDSEVWYVEASFSMLNQAMKRINGAGNKVHFIHGTEADIPNGISFNAIITNFYLDLFSPIELPGLLALLKGSLSDEGVILVSDFIQTKHWWHQWLLRIMYVFFFLSCGIDNKQLPDWRAAMRKCGLEERHAAQFLDGFIVSATFHRPNKAC
jgi:ubiquinone/menaquinone biosynthesis C-methylase UbiE